MRDPTPATLDQVVRILFKCAFIVSLTLLGQTARADSTATISVNTSALAGASAQVAFDFIDGGPPTNTVTITGFSTDGSLGSASLSGGAIGVLPGTITLTDSSFFNEYLTNMTFGTTLSFILDATTNGPGSGSLPDAFSLFILDPTTGLPLFSTTDPTGADSLLTVNIDGSSQGALFIYQAPGGEAVVSTVSAVPEQGTLSLIVCGLALGLAISKLRK